MSDSTLLILGSLVLGIVALEVLLFPHDRRDETGQRWQRRGYFGKWQPVRPKRIERDTE